MFAVVFITLLLAPRIYRSPELQQWIFTSGTLLEITTLVMIVAGLLVLALAGRLAAETQLIEEAALKEHLVNLEKQSWEAWKNRDGKFFQEFLEIRHRFC